ncbi:MULTISPECIES: DUF4129 domain-containing protein [Halolamina]|uniref:Protein-glutamine gamma-glutamyltransferase-like C-terminal domain-containing protein n=1 Tax=Halolamina pelagica TaxID=699431 RepID=A0A1I5PWA2_9EURY|nr:MULTISPECIES: DUF4129 domain-containing protein [Halolamina]NHX34965.1 DUF4129 domain-containing protein [Halolamina sp. R1-12]SFP37931.1 protein of unknown function [Halolamina pelagica]
MQRDTAVAVVLALLALLAIGAAGATLENPAAADAGSGFGDGSGGGLGSGDGSDAASNSSVGGGGGMQWTGEISGACMSVLQTLPAKLLIAGSVAALGGYVWWRTGSLGMGVLTGLLYGPIVYLMWFALAGCQTIQEGISPAQPTNRTSTANETGGGSLGAAAETATSQPSVLLVIVLGVLVLAAIVLLYVASADDVVASQVDRERDADDEETDIAAVGRVAGEAADRIETGDAFDNEVFRAWAEMTEHLAVEHPESSTPAEFATAAVDAGMAPDDVNELTDLFEEVRYGNREVTADREQRATAALRRIEESYAEAEE